MRFYRALIQISNSRIEHSLFISKIGKEFQATCCLLGSGTLNGFVEFS